MNTGDRIIWTIMKFIISPYKLMMISADSRRLSGGYQQHRFKIQDAWSITLSYRNVRMGQGGFEPLELLGGDFGLLTLSCASCSRKSDHRSASDSFRVPPSGKKSVERAGVLGVRCHGDTGTLAFGFEAPGRARPACSRCSTRLSVRAGWERCKSVIYRRSKPICLQ